VKRGICSADSVINILLCVLGYVSGLQPLLQQVCVSNSSPQIPGLIHAWYIIASYPDAYETETVDGEHGRVTYVFVHGSGNNQQQNRCHHEQPKPLLPHGGMTYGATNNNAASTPESRPTPRTQGTNGEGSSDGTVPPTYAEAVAGDHKIQSKD
jgi:uncharacterized membrane protein YqaE (UPF0057 family)